MYENSIVKSIKNLHALAFHSLRTNYVHQLLKKMMKGKRRLGVVGVCLCLLLNNCMSPETVTLPGGWHTKASLQGPARSAAVTFTIDNKAYVGTGLTIERGALADFWQYDTDTNQWTQVADFPGKARSEAVGFAVSNKGYVGTGIDGASGKLLRDFYQFDPVANAWTQVADFGGSARRSAVAFAIGQTGFVGTGTDGNEQRDLWGYDPTTDTWTRAADFGGRGRVGAAAFVINETAYVGTGNAAGINQPDFWAYDPAKNLWKERKNFAETSIARSYAVGFAINNIGYFVTGACSQRSGDYDLWGYDPTTDSWTNKSSFEGTARQKAVGFSVGSKGYVTTGVYGRASYDDLWAFTP